MLKFQGSSHFRQRILLATLSQKSIRIDDIRAQDENPGLHDFEANFLRLVDKITNGAVIEINETGTTLKYKPGVILGGHDVVHECGTKRGIGYFLEPLVILALFAKKPLGITLKGITNHTLDPSMDTFRSVTLPLLRKIGITDGLDLRIIHRGAPPEGGGTVALSVPILPQLPPLHLVEQGMIKRIRGVAHAMRVSPQNTNRMVDGARGVLNDFLADVYIFTDHMTGNAAGKSPGFGLTLVAETTSGCVISAESVADPTVGLMVPEDVGKKAALALLEEVQRGGVVDGTHQGLLLLLAALNSDEMQQVRLGPLTPYAVHTLRHIKDFLGVQFSIRPEAETRTVFCSCIGIGMKNLARKAV